LKLLDTDEMHGKKSALLRQLIAFNRQGEHSIGSGVRSPLPRRARVIAEPCGGVAMSN
jgi:hypothetical protein